MRVGLPEAIFTTVITTADTMVLKYSGDQLRTYFSGQYDDLLLKYGLIAVAGVVSVNLVFLGLLRDGSLRD